MFRVREQFTLAEGFLAPYKGRQPNWGPLGYVTYKRTYARVVTGEGGRTEEYWETLRRVAEGCYTIQLNHCRSLKLPWNMDKAQRSAQEMFRLMWDFKFLPPGRGLWMMGTDYIWERGSAALNNCAFVSTDEIEVSFSEPFCFLMDMSMLGVGVAFDTTGAGKVVVHAPEQSTVCRGLTNCEDLGYSTQACNVNSGLGCFSELEYHIPAIGKGTGRVRCDDAAQVWAFRGSKDAIATVMNRLLTPQWESET